jgi:hypothetical protein
VMKEGRTEDNRHPAKAGRGALLAVKIQNGRGFERGTDGEDAAATMSFRGVAAVSSPSHPFLRWCAETLTKQLVNSRPGASLLRRRKRQNVLHRCGLDEGRGGFGAAVRWASGLYERGGRAVFEMGAGL